MSCDTVVQCNTTLQVMERVSVQQAVVKIVTGKAVALESVDGEFIRSQRMSLPKPSIIMLTEYANGEAHRDPETEIRTLYPSSDVIHARDNRECCYCGGYGTTIDHVVPRDLGGTSKWDNVVSCCAKCNSVKDNNTLSELGWKMRYTPTRPTLRDLEATPKNVRRRKLVDSDQERVYAAVGAAM